ncbi:MAG TPA: DUF4430 domain-containing protein [Gaiellaceae bacterium]|nr:DUF4430 domain-containing protein [Gaiellaceae bacterium]
MRRTLVLALALALAGCGGSGRGHGTATLWVTTDRGAHVVFSGPVPAGSDGIRTVEGKLKVTTRYGGRYLQSVNGIAGSLSQQRDWFFYVNGIEGDRSAAEVTIHPGDVLWWDYRHWSGATMHVPVVVGAYPKPFLGESTSVVSSDRVLAAKIAKQVHGVVNAKTPLRNFIIIGGNLPASSVHIKEFRKGFLLELGTAMARQLATNPTALRYRFGS